jgi:hypothetical protein
LRGLLALSGTPQPTPHGKPRLIAEMQERGQDVGAALIADAQPPVGHQPGQE